MAMHPIGIGRYDTPANYTPLCYAFSNLEANRKTYSSIA